MATKANEMELTYQGERIYLAKAQQKKRIWDHEWFLFILFMLPNMALLTLFSYWPMVRTVILSIQKNDLLMGNTTWVGLDNYRTLIHDITFHQVIENTIIFTVFGVGFTLLFGLGTSLLINQKLRFRNFARAVVFIPFLLSGAIIGVIWAFIFNPQYGLIAGVLGWFGIAGPNWLASTQWAMPAMIIVYVWKNLGFAAVIFLAGLQSIPKDLYDAARVDGANAWWRFRSVTIPMLSPIMFFLIITSIIASFQAFDQIRVMTAGGPHYATTTLIYYVYEEGFSYAANYGLSSAAATVLFFVMLIVTIFQVRGNERRVNYDV